MVANMTDDSQVKNGRASAPRWMGALAGTAAAAVALGFSQWVEGASDIPGLVLGIGEWVIDYTPGWVVEWSIEDLGSAGKGNLLPGITLVSFLVAAMLGDVSLRRSRRWGVLGFIAFGVFGAFAAGRNPQSPTIASWFWSLFATGLGVTTLILLVGIARGTIVEPGNDELASPLNPPRSRRAFLAWSGGAGAIALTGVGLGKATVEPSAAEIARDAIVLPTTTTTTTTAATSTTTTEAAAIAPAAVATEPFVSPEGLSRWITPNEEFYRIDTAFSIPQVDPAGWRLKFTGMVDNPYELTYDEILGMDLVDQAITMSCVSNPIGGDLVGNAVWTGIPLVDLLERAGVQPGATQVTSTSVDDWNSGFPTELLGDGRNALLAVGMNGEPLPIRSGFPARLVVAGIYGYVSATKWIKEIRMTTWEDFNGYWIDLGWSKDGPMKTTSRVDVPKHRARIAAGITPVAGVAWAPTRGISAVEISIDNNDWIPCDLARPGSDETWVQWRTDWNASQGTHQIAVRAFDGNGDIQPIGPKAVAPDGAEGWHQVDVEVT
jgi:DMSO/TMAO reductase YedYZ molybdopterin-dependent catalytic subunit